jgi:hypothetical protein
MIASYNKYFKCFRLRVKKRWIAYTIILQVINGGATKQCISIYRNLAEILPSTREAI